ncbi:MAG: hypothetical protein QME06_07970 [Desulfobacterales bacterium]|nr:hypothetical protein [Desulfobacterales bacterium]
MIDNLFIINVLSLAILGFFLFKKCFLGDSLKLTRLTLPSLANMIDGVRKLEKDFSVKQEGYNNIQPSL